MSNITISAPSFTTWHVYPALHGFPSHRSEIESAAGLPATLNHDNTTRSVKPSGTHGKPTTVPMNAGPFSG